MAAKRELPPCVYLKHGAYYLVRDNKWTRLGKDKAAALRSYASLVAQRKGALAEMLIDAVDNRGVKSTTRRRYLGAVKHLAEIFAEFAPADVEPRHVYELQTMLRDSPNVYNSCLTVLRIAYEYGMQRQLVTTDPTIGVNRAREVKRSRLLAPAEFWAIRKEAGDRLQVIMDLCYLTGQRIGDVLAIRRTQLHGSGIEFTQQKTGKRLLVTAPGLAEVIERAKTLHGRVSSLTLLRGLRGGPPQYNAVLKQWGKACKAAGVLDARMHDIRAMSLTAAKAQGLDATALAGHSSEAMTARYLRARDVPTVTGPKMAKGV